MVFKVFKIFCISIFIYFSAGCDRLGLRVGESYKDPAFSGTNLGCMNELREQFDNYVKQNLRKGELGVFSQCLTTALTIFKHHVSGEKRGNYSPEELRNFLHEFFLQDSEVSDELLHHLMVFKAALVGGSTDSLTLDEIDQLNNRIQVMGKIMANIYPYNHILFNQKKLSFKELNKGVQVLKKTSSEFSDQIFQNPYSLKSAGQLFQGISQLMDFSSDQNFLWLGAVKALAPFILNSSAKKDIILPKEWPVLAESMTDLASILLHVRTTLSPVSFSQKILHYSKSFETLLVFLKNRIDEGSISRSEFLQLVQNLKEENIIPERMRYSSLERVIDVVFGKIIAQIEEDFSFGEEEFLWLANFYQTWNQRQKDIRLAVSDPDWQEKVSEENSGVIAELLKFKPLYRVEDAGFNVYLRYPSLVLEDRESEKSEEFIYKNLSMHSLYWQATSAVLGGYAEYPDYGLVESEFGSLLIDFRNFISDLSGLEASDVEVANYGRTEFIAGHLMLYETEGFHGTDELIDSDGKRLEVVSQREGTEFLAMTGFIIKTLKDLTQGFYHICPSAISRSCFIDNVVSLIQNISFTMPQLSSFLENITEEEAGKYADLLFKISVVDPEQIETLEFIAPVHIRNLVFALMYQEVTITRYDLNENTLLDKVELVKDEDELIENTYQLYDGLIKYFGVDLFCRDPQSFEEQIGFVYNYIVRHLILPPRGPDMNCLFNKASTYGVEAFVQFTDLWSAQIDRIRLMELALHLVQVMRVQSSKIMSADNSCETYEQEGEGPSLLQQIMACF
ncbi:MAG: hypothetical protein OXK80_04940 [Bdellovibrionales bacterium]|nr:hypothetical protein [Bdellovibrionales bacterium]